ncbi:MAG: hypothetical protein UDG94_00790 [Peptococcaceae bacterium]|nr:hypothetical protein [Peptococcaceae bacterium]
MLRIFILTFPFVVMAILFYIGYIITGNILPGILTIVCLIIALVILFKYNSFLHRVKKERNQQLNASQEEENTI